MIKITRFFYIHWLFFPLLALSIITGGLYTMLLAYAVVFVHEIFHILAALLVRERIGSVIVMPFGITVRLACGRIRHTGKEIFIALAGPFANALMLIASFLLLPFFSSLPISLYVFRFLNWAILLVNLLPCLPLDGGRVLKALLVRSLGHIAAGAVMKKTSRIVTIVLFITGVLLLIVTRLNISLLMIAGFLWFQTTEEKHRQEYLIMQELLYHKNKLSEPGFLRTKILCVPESLPAKNIIKRLSYDSFYIIYIVDKNQNHLRSVTETQVVNAISQKGWKISLAEI